MKKDSQNTYRNILKGTTLFGGVQIFQVLLTLVRGKFVALLLGPEGMGISSLFTTSSTTLQRFSSLGLNLAVVKEVAAGNEDDGTQARVISVARRLITLTAWGGAAVCVLLAPLLSRWTFGDASMTWQFVLLAAAVALMVAANGKLSVLQGLHQVKAISRASLVGGLTGLLVGVPLYWWFGNNGIVPAIVALSLAMYLFYSAVLHRLHLETPREFSLKEHKPMVRKLIVLGFFLMANDLFASLGQYLLNLFLQYRGSTDAVGLYQAANSITNQYAGMVFAAMAMDYFPRLSKASADNDAVRQIVNRQSEIVSIIIAPCAILLILSAPLVIRVLLTDSFLSVVPLMRWMGLGILFRALMFPLGYVIFAKGNKKLFFWMEGLGGNLVTLLLSCIFFRFYGLVGLGYALVADNALWLVIYYFVNRGLYGYRLSRGAAVHMFAAVVLGTMSFAATFIPGPMMWWVTGSLLLASTLWAILALRRKLRSA